MVISSILVKDFLSFGSRIRECRKAMGLSQEALAELLYVKKNTICRYEKDEHDMGWNTMSIAEYLLTLSC